MIEYEKIVGSEAIRALRLTTTEKGHEFGSSRFKGQTFDLILPNDKIKRITFGINEVYDTKHVACISEILTFKAEPKYEYDDYINHMLDVSYYESNWSEKHD